MSKIRSTGKTITRAGFITALAAGALPFRGFAAAETPDEKAVYDVLDAAVDAQFTYDFRRITTLLHPAATKMFRNHLSACFDNLLKSFPRNAVLAATGLSSHPKDFSLTDPEFFVFVCSHARDLDPTFIGDPKYLPLTVHGSIFENDSLAYVVYSYSGNVRTTRTDFDYIQPGNLTFRKTKGQWLIYSSFLSRRVSDFWWIQLAKPKDVPQRLL
jgi:hypothetical protein